MTSFSDKLKLARKKFGWSQDQLGKKVGIHGRHIGKYETGRAMPNAEALIKLSQALDVSIDYLLRNDVEEKESPSSVVKDQNLFSKFQAIEKMNDDDKHVITSLIDAYIKKQQIERVLNQ